MNIIKQIKIIPNTLVSFLFVESTGNTRISTFWSLYEPNRPYPHTYLSYYPESLVRAINAKKAYEIHIQRAFGLGFFASYIPGTAAFKSRMDYMFSTLALDSSIEHYVKVGQYGFIAKLYYLLATTPFSFLQDLMTKYERVAGTIPTNIRINRKDSALRLLTFFPILYAIFNSSEDSIELKPDYAWNLFHTLRNPVRLLSQFLRFIHRSIDTMFEIGSEERNPSSLPRVILKGISASIFIPIRILSVTVESVVDITWSLIENITIVPAKFLISSIKQTISLFNKEFIHTDREFLRAAKVIRKILKDETKVKDQDYGEIYSALSENKNKGKTDYLIEGKEIVYTYTKNELTAHHNIPTIIATSPEKAKQLNSYISFYKANSKQFSEGKQIDETTIQEVEQFFSPSIRVHSKA